MLSIAKDLLEEEEREREEEKERYLSESCPAPSMPRTMQELQVCHKATAPEQAFRVCRALHTFILLFTLWELFLCSIKKLKNNNELTVRLLRRLTE